MLAFLDSSLGQGPNLWAGFGFSLVWIGLPDLAQKILHLIENIFAIFEKVFENVNRIEQGTRKTHYRMHE
jgi:hypothetical protein